MSWSHFVCIDRRKTKRYVAMNYCMAWHVLPYGMCLLMISMNDTSKIYAHRRKKIKAWNVSFENTKGYEAINFIWNTQRHTHRHCGIPNENLVKVKKFIRSRVVLSFAISYFGTNLIHIINFYAFRSRSQSPRLSFIPFPLSLAPNAFLYRFVIVQKEITLALFVLWLHFFDRKLVFESGLWPPFFPH